MEAVIPVVDGALCLCFEESPPHLGGFNAGRFFLGFPQNGTE